MTLAPHRPSQRIPTWFVSSQHRRRVTTANGRTEWQPFGVHHAREAGSTLTACGELAIYWKLFWDMEFPSEPGQTTCRECLFKVASTPRGRH